MFRRTLAALFVAALALTASNFASAADLYGSDVIDAYDIHTYSIECSQGGDACIIVDGDGDTDLDLHVYDAYGNLVAVDNDYTDYCVVHFSGRPGMTYTVQVSNLGSVWNAYEIVVNP